MAKMELIMAICNVGFAEVVMDAAKLNGARGGTITHARGTTTPDIEQKYGVYVTPDKEVVLIVVPSKIRDKVLNGIYASTAKNQPGNCVAFSLPVENTIGIRYFEDLDNKKETPKEVPNPENKPL